MELSQLDDSNFDFRRTSDDAARLGHPSYVWRAGQERRLALVRQWAQLDGARILDAGCGVGMYTEQFRRFSPHVTGVEVDPGRGAARPRSRLPGIVLAPAEALPFADGSFDVLFSHEVIEHVTDDAAAAAEMTPRAGARRPHRDLLPQPALSVRDPRPLLARDVSLRQHAADQLAAGSAAQPAGAARARLHRRGAARPLRSGPVAVVHHSVIYPGFDNVVARHRAAGSVLRKGLYTLEHTPLQWFGLSHFLVLERRGAR